MNADRLALDDDGSLERTEARAAMGERVLRLAQLFDTLRPAQQSAHVRAMLRIFAIDQRTLMESAACAGCSRSSLLRAETILKRILQR